MALKPNPGRDRSPGVTFRDRMQQGRCIRAYRDVFTACLKKPPQDCGPATKPLGQCQSATVRFFQIYNNRHGENNPMNSGVDVSKMVPGTFIGSIEDIPWQEVPDRD